MQFWCLLILLKMSSSDSEDLKTPAELKETAQTVIENLLPEKSRNKYNKTYEEFLHWKSEKNTPSFSENVLVSHFCKKAQKYEPSTLRSLYSYTRMCHSEKSAIPNLRVLWPKLIC